MSTSKEFTSIRSCDLVESPVKKRREFIGTRSSDLVEPPVKKCRKFTGTRSSDLVEPPVKKCRFGSKARELALIESCFATESSEQLDLIESSKVTESSEQLDDVIESIKVTESSEQLDDVIESIKVTESSEQLDVISFLSDNGKTNYLVRSNGEFVSLNAIRGKHLIIFAVSLPSLSLEDTLPFWRFVTEAYHELCQAGFEIVVSVTVKRDKQLRFDKFISNLPCLSIPYPDCDTRNSVCSYLNTHYKSTNNVFPSVIVVDPAGVILPYRDIPCKILRYGFEWLTTNRNVRDIYVEDQVLKARLDMYYKKCWDRSSIDLTQSINADIFDQPLSLHRDFLLCDPSRVLTRFDNQSLPVSELSKKHVALYLCHTGYFTHYFSEVYKQCLENNQELEVVLVCMPYFEEPKSYYDKVTGMLKRYDLKSWFIFPFDNKVCFRLWRAFRSVWDEERVIILPPNCKSSGELEGRAIIRRMGIKAYPFTRRAILEQRFNTLKSLDPVSLFQGSSKKLTCLVRNGKNVRLSAIQGKKLILYFDWLNLFSDGGYLCQLLMKLYPKIRAKGCEVVFVPLDETVGCSRHVNLAKMPWPMMTDEAAIKGEVPHIFRFGDEDYCRNQLVAFGKDGKILSRWTRETLVKYGFTKRIFHDNVRQEISLSLGRFGD